MEQQYVTRWLLGALVAVGALLLVGPLLLGVGGSTTGWGSGMTGGMWGPTHDSWMGSEMIGSTSGWWLLVAVVWRLLLVVALVGGGYLLYRTVAADRPDPAIRELRQAYARGDLSEEEFERRRDRLEQEQ